MDEIVQLSILNILNKYILERAEVKRRLISAERLHFGRNKANQRTEG
jgi:hypothetical protein